MSKDTVKRYIRLTNLIPKLLELVDDKKISFTPAVELSYLDAKQQCDFMEVMDTTQNAPSLSQAQRIKKLAQQGKFSYDAVYDIMNEVKKSELDTVTIKNETLRKYFPRSYTPRQMEEKIIQLLEAWQQQRQQAKLKSANRKQNDERKARLGLYFCKNSGGNAHEQYDSFQSHRKPYRSHGTDHRGREHSVCAETRHISRQ